MTAPVRDRRRAPQPVRSPLADRPRRHLTVVDEKRLTIAKRRRRVRALAIGAGVLVVAGLFALAAFHAMLASGQARLDVLQAEVDDAQARYQSLRLDVAELEAPDRIVREAHERLGMVLPTEVTYLSPSTAMADEVGAAAAAPSPTSSEARERAAYAAVKPYLSGGR